MIILKLRGPVDAAGQRARDLLTLVGLSDRMNFLPRDLSGGQKQRVAIARSLAADSPAILADEPTGNLDHLNGRKVMEILRKLAVEQNRCVIVATHDNRIEDFFDRTFQMEDGRIIGEREGRHEEQSLRYFDDNYTRFSGYRTRYLQPDAFQERGPQRTSGC